MKRLPVVESQTLNELRERVASAREQPEVTVHLERAIAHLDEALAQVQRARSVSASTWRALDHAYEAVDRYLDALVRAAEVPVSCGPGCSACCTEAPPVHALEGLRLARALLARKDGRQRVQRAVEQARSFQTLLMDRMSLAGAGNRAQTRSAMYRETQKAWRRARNNCPILGDDGRCSAYAARPLACRVYVSVDDPAKCDTRHEGFETLQRPALWSSPRERVIEQRLAAIGAALGLKPAPNLQWAVAQLHNHRELRR